MIEPTESPSDSTASATRAWLWPAIPAASFPAPNAKFTTSPMRLARIPRWYLAP